LPPEQALTSSNARTDAKAIRDQLADLRVRCQRQTGSIITPMGDEMFYRYQESLIDEAMTTLAILLQRSPGQHNAASS
jgi:UDP-N-acetylenolpyruvoylglucosamine reductase